MDALFQWLLANRLVGWLVVREVHGLSIRPEDRWVAKFAITVSSETRFFVSWFSGAENRWTERWYFNSDPESFHLVLSWMRGVVDNQPAG